MKIRCGGCGTCFFIADVEKLRKKQSLRCGGCGNVFIIHPDRSFSSAGKNSQRICDYCGQFAEEGEAICRCGGDAADSGVREAQRIDNKEYQFFVVRRGRLQPKHRKVNWFGRSLLLAGATALAAGLIIVLYLPGGQRDTLKNAILKTLHLPGRTETKVVILHSGQVHYAEKIEHQGAEVKITTKDGRVIQVREQDIRQISAAVIED